jgi:hypothetical protein
MAMRVASMLRFILFGAIGFGAGVFVGIEISVSTLWIGMLLGPLVAGAVGGAALGLASQDRRRVVVLALLGAVGLTVGIIAGLVVGSFFNYGWPTGAVVGAIVGGSLGVAFRDWRTIVALVIVGAVGCSVGHWLGHFVRATIPILSQIREVGSITITGAFFGALLGAALGYLESRNSASERRPRVR